MVKNTHLGDRAEPIKLNLPRNPGKEQWGKMKPGVDRRPPICKITTGMVIIRNRSIAFTEKSKNLSRFVFPSPPMMSWSPYPVVWYYIMQGALVISFYCFITSYLENLED